MFFLVFVSFYNIYIINKKMVEIILNFFSKVVLVFYVQVI